MQALDTATAGEAMCATSHMLRLGCLAFQTQVEQLETALTGRQALVDIVTASRVAWALFWLTVRVEGLMVGVILTVQTGQHWWAQSLRVRQGAVLVRCAYQYY
jgi:hypothetical protein